jgi:hypothetical protein
MFGLGLPSFRASYAGLIFVLFMLFAPGGLSGLAYRLADRSWRGSRCVAPRLTCGKLDKVMLRTMIGSIDVS